MATTTAPPNLRVDDAFLGILLNRGTIPTELRPRIRPEIFEPSRRLMARAILSVWDRLGTCSPAAVAEELARQDGHLADTLNIGALMEAGLDLEDPEPLLRLLEERREARQPAERPVIDATDLDLPRVAAAAWLALAEASDPPVLFRFGGIPSRIERDDDGRLVLRPLNPDRLRYELARAASWRKGHKPNARAALPPGHVVRDLLAHPDPPLLPITRLVGAPVFAPDGRLLQTPGYHREAQVFYAPAPGLLVPDVGEAPPAEEIARARAFLLGELLGDFPFVGDADRAHAVALLLLPFVRELIDGRTPLHLIEKPSPGTGAGLLVDMATLPALGGSPARMTEGRDEDEWRKRLTAKLTEGPAIIVLDNVRRRLDSAALSAAITASVWEDRLLGQTQMVRARVRCAWAATGNNPALSNEMVRRTVRIRLDARVDRPWLRTEFKHPDLRTWATTQRGELIWACLTIIRGWIAAGQPPCNAMLGEFEGWARVVGGILEVTGIPGFLGNLAEFYEAADAEGGEIRRLLLAWWEKYETTEVGVRDLFEVATADDVTMDLPGKSDRAQRIQLGQRLAAIRDRRYNLRDDLEVRIVATGKERRANRWRLERCAVPGGLENIHSHSLDSPPGR